MMHPDRPRHHPALAPEPDKGHPPTAIALFGYQANVLMPWAEAGYRSVAIDYQHQPNPQPGVIHLQSDLRAWGQVWSWTPVFVSAGVPCTHMAVSGARWF